jgi:uncharacterized membrane protein YuzA (DUF378 family)
MLETVLATMTVVTPWALILVGFLGVYMLLVNLGARAARSANRATA